MWEPERLPSDSISLSTIKVGSVPISQLANLPIAIPPLAEQHRIVAKVDQLMALCGQLEAAIETQQHATSRLLDALIAEALADSPKPQSVEAGVQLALGF
jgi:type I restriction enzyme S subunit